MKLKTYQPKKQKRKRKSVFIIGIIVIVIIGFRNCQQEENDKFFSHDSFTMEQEISMIPEKNCNTQLNWHAGARQMYQLTIVKTDKTYPGALEGQANDNDGDNPYALKMNMEISGILNIRIFAQLNDLDSDDSEIIYMGCQMSPVKVTVGDDSESMIRDASLEVLFQNFFLVAMQPDGLPESFYFPSYLDIQSRMSLSEIIFGIQTFVPLSDNHFQPKKWRSEERHAFGMFKVEYMLEPHNCNSLIKQNVRCTALKDLDRTMLKADQVQFRGILELSNHHITVSEKGASWIEAYTGEEILAIYASQHAVWYRRHTKIIMNLDTRQPNGDLFIWKTNTPVSQLIDKFVSLNESNQSKQKPMKKLTASERIPLAAQLELLQKDISSNVDQEIISQRIQLLKKYLTQFPEEISFIPHLIKNLNIQDSVAEQIILTLEMIGNEEAQNAMSEIYLDYNQAPDIRQKAIISAGGLSEPSMTTIDRLFQLISQEQSKTDTDINHSDAAILSIGLLTQTLYLQKDNESAKNVFKRLTSLLQAFSDERHVIVCLKAIGNTKIPDGASTLIPYLNSESHLARKTAVIALGNLDVAAKNEDETQGIEADPEINTEKEISSSKSITSNVSMRLIEHLNKESQADIRQDIIEAIIKRKEPEVMDTLDNILHDETDIHLQDMIRSYIESNN
ncbi:conserved hypothetical protein, secreted [Candidatus Magnetomorum sp. HK-1]|nr:conserved hypothetical protein, secreted [Candidatus Magnetomorum sp. HK-1]